MASTARATRGVRSEPVRASGEAPVAGREVAVASATVVPEAGSAVVVVVAVEAGAVPEARVVVEAAGVVVAVEASVVVVVAVEASVVVVVPVEAGVVVVVAGSVVVVDATVVLDELLLVELLVELLLVELLVELLLVELLVVELLVVELLVELLLVELLLGGAVHDGLVMMLVSRVTAPLIASRRPSTVAPVLAEMLVRARTDPTNMEPTSTVAELPTCQKTLHAWAPPVSITRLLTAVISVDWVWKMKTSSGPPLSVRVPVIPNVPDAEV